MTPTEQEFKAYLRELGAQGGRKAASNMTQAQRTARAKKAVAAREAKRKQKLEATRSEAQAEP
ncbi:MAG TPA: hypothetical protein VMF91_11925 [Bryobacteraceae bacterium]|nr:hypothetical protein [Bryobacteraceae bacterium]